jgi:hypothetical protein
LSRSQSPPTWNCATFGTSLQNRIAMTSDKHSGRDFAVIVFSRHTQKRRPESMALLSVPLFRGG